MVLVGEVSQVSQVSRDDPQRHTATATGPPVPTAPPDGHQATGTSGFGAAIGFRNRCTIDVNPLSHRQLRLTADTRHRAFRVSTTSRGASTSDNRTRRNHKRHNELRLIYG